jgi:hypothetical protein
MQRISSLSIPARGRVFPLTVNCRLIFSIWFESYRAQAARRGDPQINQSSPAIHPGEILRAEFMEPFHLSPNRLALNLQVPVTRIAEIGKFSATIPRRTW